MHKVILIEDDFHIGQLMKENINKMTAYQCDHIFSNPIDFFNNPIQATIYLLDIISRFKNYYQFYKRRFRYHI